jgi:cytosol alanyl aminopeptidase
VESDSLRLAPDSQPSQQSGFVSLLGHEIAHQWFGDLVSPQWWDDLWLSESLATFVRSQVMLHDFRSLDTGAILAKDRLRAFEKDENAAAKPLRTAVRSASDIADMFDNPNHRKGEAILRMIDTYFGDPVIRKGLQKFLSTNQWRSVPGRSLLDSLTLTTGADIGRILGPLLDRSGFPILDVDLKTDGKSPILTVRRRWQPDGEHQAAIPILIRYGSRQGARSKRVLLMRGYERISVCPTPRCAT